VLHEILDKASSKLRAIEMDSKPVCMAIEDRTKRGAVKHVGLNTESPEISSTITIPAAQ
jgi:hypothetical protein